MKLMRNEWLHVACRQLRPNLIVVVLVALGLLGMALAKMAHAQAMSTTTVQGTLYMANGQTGSGTLQVSWPSFTTAGGQAVVAGNTTVAIGSDGFVSVNLTPNLGASPAGLYYTAVFYLSNGTTTTQYWVVPAAAQATLAQVQSQVMPAAQAVQAVSKAYVDQAIAEAGQSQLSASGETMTGPLYLNADPTQAMQAADKHYVDVSVSQSSTQPGTAGQIAYYTGTGTAIAGMNAVPVAAGGTGAGTAASALQNLGGISAKATTQQAMIGGLSIAGPVAAQAVTASVNSQLNVMATPYNAKGDCVTDDSAAIQAALNVQWTSPSQITVYFPAPPGGCYLTSTLTVTGASMQGQIGAGASGATGAGVVIRGEPGEDILHEPDPNTAGSVNPRTGWSIREIVFQVDGSEDVSATLGAHRWPGKWTNDGSINASSYTFTSPNQEITCGDIGENILVKGAGASGADLSTTIANVFPCWANYGSGGLTVTLTAAASTSVTNAYAYITPAHIPVTQHIGNCALAADNYDGNPAHWVISGGVGTLEPSLLNVTTTLINNPPNVRNNTCGIYFGAAWNPYMLDAKNLWMVNTAYGIVEGTPDTNPQMGGIGNDFQKFDHGFWTGNIYPWISYNDGEIEMDEIQLAVAYGIAAASGPQVLQVGSASEYLPSSWYIHVPEMEYVENEAWRIEGGSATVVGTELCDGQTGTIDTIDSRFINSNCGGSLRMNGSGNWLDGGGNSIYSLVNNGMDNIYVGSGGSTSTGMRVTTPQTSTLNRGQQAWGTLTPDFVRNGTAPYYSDHDLFIWPQDFTDAFGVIYNVIADSNSWTGNYVDIPSGGNFNYFNNMYMLGRTGSSSPANQIVAGSNIPAGPVVVEFSYKCPSLTSFLVNIKANGTTVGAVTPSCTTSYQTATVSADFTGYSGDAFGFALGAGEVDIAWMAIVPLGNVNAKTVTLAGATSGSYVKADGTGYGTPSSGVTQILAGANVTISPSGGTGNVTINASGGLPVRALPNQFNDVFQRAGANLGTGWTNYLNGWVPNSGAAHSSSSSTSLYSVAAYTGATSTPAAQTSTVVMSSVGGAGDYVGPIVRVSGTPTTSVSFYFCSEGQTQLYFGKVTGASNSSIGANASYATTTVSGAAGDVLTLQVVGNTLSCYRNGIEVGVANDTNSPLTTGYPGIYQSGDTDTVSSFTYASPAPVSGCNVNIVADGDSETFGYGVTSPYTDSIYTSAGTVPCIANLGVPGKAVGVTIPATVGSIESMITTGATVVDPLYHAGMQNIDIIWGCTNDIGTGGRTPAQCNTDLATYIMARHSAGWKVILVQSLSRGDSSDAFDTKIQSLNQLTASGTGADEVVTLPLALTGTNGWASTSLFQSDKVHGTQLTMTSFIARAVSAAIDALQ